MKNPGKNESKLEKMAVEIRKNLREESKKEYQEEWRDKLRKKSSEKSTRFIPRRSSNEVEKRNSNGISGKKITIGFINGFEIIPLGKVGFQIWFKIQFLIIFHTFVESVYLNFSTIMQNQDDDIL